MIDDAGFGASSAFGGPCDTPNAERLAANGLQFNRFHTTALCSPTAPGAADRPQPPRGRAWAASPRSPRRRRATDSVRPTTAAPLAETLKLNGYSTAQFGKCHEVPVWETSPMGPFDQWPTGSGFEHFYGFVGGGDEPVVPGALRRDHPGRAAEDAGGGLPLHRGPDRQGDHLGRSSRSRSCPTSRSSCTSRPGATHAPHHVPDGVERQVQGPLRRRAGTRIREETFARQKAARRHPRRRRADRPPGGDPGVGRRRRRPQADAGAPDGGLRRVPRAHRPSHRPARRRARATSASSTTR